MRNIENHHRHYDHGGYNRSHLGPSLFNSSHFGFVQVEMLVPETVLPKSMPVPYATLPPWRRPWHESTPCRPAPYARPYARTYAGTHTETYARTYARPSAGTYARTTIRVYDGECRNRGTVIRVYAETAGTTIRVYAGECRYQGTVIRIYAQTYTETEAETNARAHAAPNADIRPEPTPESTPEPTQDHTLEPTPVPTPEPTPELEPNPKHRFRKKVQDLIDRGLARAV